LECLPAGLGFPFSIRDEKQLTCRNSTGSLFATIEANKIRAKGWTGGWARAAKHFTQIERKDITTGLIEKIWRKRSIGNRSDKATLLRVRSGAVIKKAGLLR
jgi:hypothetical protein